MTARVTMHEAAILELLTGPTGPVFRQVESWTTRTTTLAKTRCPADEGVLRASIDGTVRVDGLKVIGRVGTPLEYGWYVHDGTGIFGPKGRPIVPVHAKVLVFEPGRSIGPLARGGKHLPKGKRGLVFAASSKGTPPNPFLFEALQDAVPFPVRRNR
jgi:hypothetical protein